MSDYHLIVVHPHADYAKGDVVKDRAMVEALLRDHPAKVIKTAATSKKT